MAKEINDSDIKEYFKKAKLTNLVAKSKADEYLLYAELAEKINAYNETPELKNYIAILEVFEKNKIPSYHFIDLMEQFSEKDKKKVNEQVILEETKAMIENIKKEIKILEKAIAETSGKAMRELKNKTFELADDLSNERTEVQKTIKQVKKINSIINDTYKVSLNGKKGHDRFMKVLSVGAKAIGITGYLGGKTTLKLSKFALKTTRKVSS